MSNASEQAVCTFGFTGDEQVPKKPRKIRSRSPKKLVPIDDNFQPVWFTGTRSCIWCGANGFATTSERIRHYCPTEVRTNRHVPVGPKAFITLHGCDDENGMSDHNFLHQPGPRQCLSSLRTQFWTTEFVPNIKPSGDRAEFASLLQAILDASDAEYAYQWHVRSPSTTAQLITIRIIMTMPVPMTAGQLRLILERSVVASILSFDGWYSGIDGTEAEHHPGWLDFLGDQTADTFASSNILMTHEEKHYGGSLLPLDGDRDRQPDSILLPVCDPMVRTIKKMAVETANVGSNRSFGNGLYELPFPTYHGRTGDVQCRSKWRRQQPGAGRKKQDCKENSGPHKINYNPNHKGPAVELPPDALRVLGVRKAFLQASVAMLPDPQIWYSLYFSCRAEQRATARNQIGNDRLEPGRSSNFTVELLLHGVVAVSVIKHFNDSQTKTMKCVHNQERVGGKQRCTPTKTELHAFLYHICERPGDLQRMEAWLNKNFDGTTLVSSMLSKWIPANDGTRRSSFFEAILGMGRQFWTFFLDLATRPVDDPEVDSLLEQDSVPPAHLVCRIEDLNSDWTFLFEIIMAEPEWHAEYFRRVVVQKRGASADNADDGTDDFDDDRETRKWHWTVCAGARRNKITRMRKLVEALRAANIHELMPTAARCQHVLEGSQRVLDLLKNLTKENDLYPNIEVENTARTSRHDEEKGRVPRQTDVLAMMTGLTDLIEPAVRDFLDLVSANDGTNRQSHICRYVRENGIVRVQMVMLLVMLLNYLVPNQRPSVLCGLTRASGEFGCGYEQEAAFRLAAVPAGTDGDCTKMVYGYLSHLVHSGDSTLDREMVSFVDMPLEHKNCLAGHATEIPIPPVVSRVLRVYCKYVHPALLGQDKGFKGAENLFLTEEGQPMTTKDLDGLFRVVNWAAWHQYWASRDVAPPVRDGQMLPIHMGSKCARKLQSRSVKQSGLLQHNYELHRAYYHSIQMNDRTADLSYEKTPAVDVGAAVGEINRRGRIKSLRSDPGFEQDVERLDQALLEIEHQEQVDACMLPKGTSTGRCPLPSIDLHSELMAYHPQPEAKDEAQEQEEILDADYGDESVLADGEDASEENNRTDKDEDMDKTLVDGISAVARVLVPISLVFRLPNTDFDMIVEPESLIDGTTTAQGGHVAWLQQWVETLWHGIGTIVTVALRRNGWHEWWQRKQKRDTEKASQPRQVLLAFACSEPRKTTSAHLADVRGYLLYCHRVHDYIPSMTDTLLRDPRQLLRPFYDNGMVTQWIELKLKQSLSRAFDTFKQAHKDKHIQFRRYYRRIVVSYAQGDSFLRKLYKMPRTLAGSVRSVLNVSKALRDIVRLMKAPANHGRSSGSHHGSTALNRHAAVAQIMKASGIQAQWNKSISDLQLALRNLDNQRKLVDTYCSSHERALATGKIPRDGFKGLDEYLNKSLHHFLMPFFKSINNHPDGMGRLLDDDNRTLLHHLLSFGSDANCVRDENVQYVPPPSPVQQLISLSRRIQEHVLTQVMGTGFPRQSILRAALVGSFERATAAEQAMRPLIGGHIYWPARIKTSCFKRKYIDRTWLYKELAKIVAWYIRIVLPVAAPDSVFPEALALHGPNPKSTQGSLRSVPELQRRIRERCFFLARNDRLRLKLPLFPLQCSRCPARADPVKSREHCRVCNQSVAIAFQHCVEELSGGECKMTSHKVRHLAVTYAVGLIDTTGSGNKRAYLEQLAQCMGHTVAVMLDRYLLQDPRRQSHLANFVMEACFAECYTHLRGKLRCPQIVDSDVDDKWTNLMGIARHKMGRAQAPTMAKPLAMTNEEGLDQVKKERILRETIEKEDAFFRPFTAYKPTPKSLHYLPPKPQDSMAAHDVEDPGFYETLKRMVAPPVEKYDDPATTAHEYGWHSNPLIAPVLPRDSRLHHPREGSQITKFAAHAGIFKT
eukprot:Clim_evm15s221 gene=Clim_evmTU15s221